MRKLICGLVILSTLAACNQSVPEPLDSFGMNGTYEVQVHQWHKTYSGATTSDTSFSDSLKIQFVNGFVIFNNAPIATLKMINSTADSVFFSSSSDVNGMFTETMGFDRHSKTFLYKSKQESPIGSTNGTDFTEIKNF